MAMSRFAARLPGMAWYCPSIAALVLGLSIPLQAVAQAGTAFAAHVRPGSVTLDGHLDDPAWRSAKPFALTQQDPHPGAATPYQTTVRILVDGQHVYFGIRNVDPEPAAISVHTLQRDRSQDNDDHLTIVLDTFGARRLGYFFQINAGGARNDGLDADDQPDNNWNGIWGAEVARTPDGWTAEIVIPTRSLQFSPTLGAWGLNVQRYVPRDQLVLRWSGITLDSDVYDLHRTGQLEGVAGLEQGMGLDIQPYVLARHDSAPGGGHSQDVGVNIKYNFTPQLTGIFTANPDFAEAEAEQGQVNLTRFSLFLPETRPFFLEGSNLFTFSHLLNVGDDGNLSTRFVPYFSRRIGLVDGQVVPIEEGAKLIGKAGRFSIGALDVDTAGSHAVPAANLGVARAAYDINANLRVGTLLTHGDPSGQTDNTFAGVDGVWHTSHFRGDRNLTLSGWLGRSSGNLLPGNASGYGFGVQYPNDLWSLRLRFNQFGDALDPALGYLPRPGTRQYMLFAGYQPRPQGGLSGWVRQFHFASEYIQVDDLEGHPQSKLFMLVPLRFMAQDGSFYNTLISSRYESLASPFTVAGVAIPAGRYRFNQFNMGWQSPKSSQLTLSADASAGDFYTGTLKEATVEADWTSVDGKLQLGLSDENDFGHLPQGDFVIRLAKLNAAWSFTPDLAVTTYAQYDTGSRTTGINAQLHWILRPGRELFVVLNHGIQPQLADINHAAPAGNELSAKLRWDFSR